MKTLRYFILIATLITVLLVGCGPAPKATATSAPTDVPATEAAQPTATEPTPLPTATAAPTAIPATSTPSASQQEQEKLAALVAPCKSANLAVTYSPKKDWVFATCMSENQDGLSTKFARTDGSKQVNVSFVDAYISPYKADDANMSTLLQQFFTPVRWTMNEDFVYLAVPSVIEHAPFKGYDGLLRLDLSTGKTTPVLRPATAPLSVSYAFSFSPGGNKLAYINESVKSVTVVIDDTATGEQQTIKLDARFDQGGSLSWSPDDKKLAVSVVDTSTNGGNSVIIYDLENNTNEFILQQPYHIYSLGDWADATTITAVNDLGADVYIDLVAKEVRNR